MTKRRAVILGVMCGIGVAFLFLLAFLTLLSSIEIRYTIDLIHR